MRKLFTKITGNEKDYFNLESFLRIYRSKPEVVSWFDYFKEDDGADLVNLVQNIDGIVSSLQSFVSRMTTLFESLPLKSERAR